MKRKSEKKKPWNPWTGGSFHPKEPAVGPARFGKIDYEAAAREAEEMIAEMEHTGEFPDWLKESLAAEEAERARRDALTGVDRLAYYRSHGLDKCDDYPGGDAQFEADVLSGEQRIEGVTLESLGREDAYIIDRMKDGRFRYGSDFCDFKMRPEVNLAYEENAHKNGFVVHVYYSSSTPGQHRQDVLSGKYARDILAKRTELAGQEELAKKMKCGD